MNPVSAFFDSLWNAVLGLNFGYVLTLVVLVLAGILVFRELYNWLKRTLKQYVMKTADEFDDRLYRKFAGVGMGYYSLLITWLVATVIAGSAGAEGFGNSLFYKLLSLATLVWTVYEASKFVELFLYWWQVRRVQKQQQKTLDETRVGLWSLLIKIGLWSIAFLVGLTLFGLRPESVLGAAGIGALVLALGLRSILEDLFSSLLIYLDRPFRVGDLIAVNGTKGRIKRIGMKTTRLETLSGEEMIISNTKLLGTEINNYRRMSTRRVEFNLSLSSNTSPKKIKKLQSEIKKWFEKHSIQLVHNALVAIKSGSLELEGVYLLNDPDYETFIQTQEKVNYFLLEAVKKCKIELK